LSAGRVDGEGRVAPRRPQARGYGATMTIFTGPAVTVGVPAEVLRPLPRRTPICEVDGRFYVPGWVGADRAERLASALLEGRARVEGGYIVLLDVEEGLPD
jgi:hypothetical protein